MLRAKFSPILGYKTVIKLIQTVWESSHHWRKLYIHFQTIVNNMLYRTKLSALKLVAYGCDLNNVYQVYEWEFNVAKLNYKINSNLLFYLGIVFVKLRLNDFWIELEILLFISSFIKTT